MCYTPAAKTMNEQRVERTEHYKEEIDAASQNGQADGRAFWEFLTRGKPIENLRGGSYLHEGTKGVVKSTATRAYTFGLFYGIRATIIEGISPESGMTPYDMDSLAEELGSPAVELFRTMRENNIPFGKPETRE